MELSFNIHKREYLDFKYVYPVLSRRAQGLSIGINLNVNNACNWRCIYCQVENLTRGHPLPINLNQLEFELNLILDELLNNGLLTDLTPPNMRRINDISISGNGEPTLSADILSVVNIISKMKDKYNIKNSIKTILITNGSGILKENMDEVLAKLNLDNAEVWFKVDRVTDAGISFVNQINLKISEIEKKLHKCASLCPTYIQTCIFKNYNALPSEDEILSLVNFINQTTANIKGIYLYSTARNPALIEGSHISSLNNYEMQKISALIQRPNFTVRHYV